MLTLAHRVIKFVVLTQNMAKFTSIFSLANNFSVAAQPVSDEIMCQISHMYNLQSAEQKNNIIPAFKQRKMVAVWQRSMTSE